MKRLVVGTIILLSYSMNTQAQGQAEVSHGTINVILGNANGLVVLTDSMATSGTHQSPEPAQKLFTLDAHTVCTMAGLLKAPIPYEGFYPDTASIIDAYSRELVGKPPRPIQDKLRDLEFRFNLILSGVADAQQARYPRGASAAGYALDLIIAGYDTDGNPKIAKLELRSRLVNGRFESSTDKIFLTDVGTKLVHILGGMPEIADALLAEPSASSEPALIAYASSIAKDGGESLSMQQMQELAVELAAQTHKVHPEVGGPNQIAWLQDGKVSTVVQQSFPKPKTPLPFKFYKNIGAEGEKAIGDLSPLLCVDCNFKKMHLALDRNYFVGTTFEDVVLTYDQGQAVLDQDNKLVRCVLKLGPHAAITSPLVQHLIHGFQWLRIDYDENVPYPLRVPS